MAFPAINFMGINPFLKICVSPFELDNLKPYADEIETMRESFIEILNKSPVASLDLMVNFAKKLRLAIQKKLYSNTPAFQLRFSTPLDNIDEIFTPIHDLPEPFTQNLTSLYMNGNDCTVKFSKALLPSLQAFNAREDERVRRVARPSSDRIPPSHYGNYSPIALSLNKE